MPRAGASGRPRAFAGVATWPMLAGLGAGLVLLALGAGAFGGGTAAVGEIAAGSLLLGAGGLALGWAVVALRSGRTPVPAATLAVAVGTVVALAVVAPLGALAPLPIVVAAALLLVVAGAAALRLRRTAPVARRAPGDAPAARSAHGPSTGADGPWVLPGLVVGAILVALLTVPALAATEAGGQAVPHHAPMDGTTTSGHHPARGR